MLQPLFLYQQLIKTEAEINNLKTYITAFFTVVGLSLCSPLATLAQEVMVSIKGIENNKGNIRMHIFTSDNNFKEKKAYKRLNFSKKDMKNGMLTLHVSLPAGEYGISLLDDENKNNEMDYNFIHMPQEGFGFSDYYHTGLSMPKYDSFKFTLEDKATKNVVVKMRYM